MIDLSSSARSRELVMVSNRLPVDRVMEPDGSVSWKPSPGGLVTAVEPVVQQLGCLWIGWAGAADEELEPFTLESMRLVPVSLSGEEVEGYYEGFSNGTLWPLYHDVIAPPVFHREWWDMYQRVNQRFADRIAEHASHGAIVWVHDYQLQLVPGMLREKRPDLTVVFFLHIPFPARRFFAQLPWRKQILDGLLGADVIGFQRVQDSLSFHAAVERFGNARAYGNIIVLPETEGGDEREVLAQEFPISIDVDEFAAVANKPQVQARAREIREEFGEDKTVLLGVDRLDYTKGIHHRLKAYAELLAEGEVTSENTVLVQVATPSREEVQAYQDLRDEIEATVGRINGDFGTIKDSPVVYLHRGLSREELVALYLAADVMLVTSLRDGMNLVAKEYVACRTDEQGVLVLSEFTGAADELRESLRVNPHDIEGLKAAYLRAILMPEAEATRRMRTLRKSVSENTVARWADNMLRAAYVAADAKEPGEVAIETDDHEASGSSRVYISSDIEAKLRRLATAPDLIIACDFDGTLAPIVARPQDARILPRAQQALDALHEAPNVHIVLVSGRSLESLLATGVAAHDWIVSGSHGAELMGIEQAFEPLATEEEERLDRLKRRVRRVFRNEVGVRIEEKPFGVVVHTREVEDEKVAEEILEAAAKLGEASGLEIRAGKQVQELAVRKSDKGSALQYIRSQLPEAPVLFLGDDVTDEDVFAALKSDDVGIKVGEGESVATSRVEDPATVSAILARLVELRTGIVIGSDQSPRH